MHVNDRRTQAYYQYCYGYGYCCYLYDHHHHSQSDYGHFSRWTWVSPYQNVCILDFIGAKDDGGGEW